MCFACDNNLGPRETLVAMSERIDEHGWIVTGIESGPRTIAYTVGLTAKGWPELVMTGSDWHEMAAFLNHAARAVTQAPTYPRVGGYLDVEVGGETRRVRLNNYSKPDKHLPILRRIYAHRHREALRVVI